MTQFVLTLVIVMAGFAAMAVGVIAGRKPIKGSCGGMSALGMDTACEICGGDRGKCDEEQQRNSAGVSTALGYDAAAQRQR